MVRMPTRAVWSVVCSTVAIVLEMAALKWWEGKVLPAADLQNAVYGAILLLTVLNAALGWPSLRGLLTRSRTILMGLPVLLWVVSFILCVQLILILLGAVRLGSS